MRNLDSQPLKDKTIAVVDDDMAICDSMRALLQAHEIRVFTYVSGKRFLEDAPDIACAIVDYEMPCLDGLRVIAELRKRATTVPIIMMTASINTTLEEKAATLDINKVLEKPFAPGALLDAIYEEVT